MTKITVRKKLTSYLLTIWLIGIGSFAFAEEEGPYLGLQLGESNNNNKSADMQTNSGIVTADPTNTGLAGRLFLGYSLNSYFALEAGYTHYASSVYKSDASSSNPQVTENGVDLTAKASWGPNNMPFDIFGKVGVAAILRKQPASLASSSLNSTQFIQKTSTLVSPLFGVGVSYAITPNWITDLSVTHVLGIGGLEPINFAAVGISYHFVDRYCGQFLC